MLASILRFVREFLLFPDDHFIVTNEDVDDDDLLILMLESISLVKDVSFF